MIIRLHKRSTPATVRDPESLLKLQTSRSYMSPFATELRKLRFELGVSQQALAEALGCDRTYLSALENDTRPAPGKQFVERVVAALDLSAADAQRLQISGEKSKRTHAMPLGVPGAAYEFVTNVFSQLENLSSSQIQALNGVLESYITPEGSRTRGPKLSSTAKSEEHPM